MITLPVYADVARLATRGLPASEIARGLDLPLEQVQVVVKAVKDDGERDLYVDDILGRVKSDPHRLDAAVYLYVRGVPWAVATDHVGLAMGGNRRWRAPTAFREAYQKNQLRMAVAGVLP